jgi:GNAT superfamily N-acetyltransferase
MPDGTRLFFRPVRPTDEPLMKSMFYSCSDQSIYERFFGYVKSMPHARLQKSVNLDYRADMSIVGLVNENGQERMVAVGYYSLDPETGLAEVAFLVQDDYQGRGIGTFLLQYLKEIGQSQGINGFTADVLASNHTMLDVFRRSGLITASSFSDGICHLELCFSAQVQPV